MSNQSGNNSTDKVVRVREQDIILPATLMATFVSDERLSFSTHGKSTAR